MKKSLIRTIALTSALALTLPLFAACGDKDPEAIQPASHVSVDINPSLSFSLDEKNKVLSVHASNEDAQILLYGEHFVGLDIEAALGKLADLSVDLDFVNEGNHGVNVSVSGKLGENEVMAKLQAAFDKEAGSLDINVSADGTFTDLRELEALKAAYEGNADVQNLTVSDYRLIVEAQAVNGALAFEDAVKMQHEKLMAMIAEGAMQIEPYATGAYKTAMAVAERTYNELKGQLLDSLWIAPYAKDYLNILTGRKYKVNNGVLYNLYTGSSRVLAVAIDTMEAVTKLMNETTVPAATLEKVATALNLTEEQKTAFIAEVTVDGKITLASLEDYLNKWFKNLTADERAALKATVDSIIADVQAFAVTIENSIAEEYKAAIIKLAEDVQSLIPEDIESFVSIYAAEFALLTTQLAEAVDGKEPLVAVKAVKETIDASSERIMSTMRNELTDEDLKSVEDSIARVNNTLAGYEKSFADAKAKAEADAKAWLEAAKASRAN